MRRIEPPKTEKEAIRKFLQIVGNYLEDGFQPILYMFRQVCDFKISDAQLFGIYLAEKRRWEEISSKTPYGEHSFHPYYTEII